MTQCSPCYSAVSSTLNQIILIVRHLPHPLPHSPDQYFTSLFGPDPLPSLLRWRLILHCCSALLQNLVGNSGVSQCLEEAEQQAEANVDVPPPLQIVISVPFLSLFSLSLASLCSLSQSSLFSLSSFPLASPPFLLSLLINSLSF